MCRTGKTDNDSWVRHFHKPLGADRPCVGGKGMTAKEWAVQAFETCDHAGMICMSCAEEAIRAAIEEDRASASETSRGIQMEN